MMLDTNGPRPLLKKTTQDLGEFLVVAAERCTSSLNISPSSFPFLAHVHVDQYIPSSRRSSDVTRPKLLRSTHTHFLPSLHFLKIMCVAGRFVLLVFRWLRLELHRQKKKATSEIKVHNVTK